MLRAKGPATPFFGLGFGQKFKQDPLGTIQNLKRDFGDVVYLRLGPYDWYVLNHADHVRDVLVKHSKQFGKTEPFKRILGSVDGQGLVLSEGDLWLRQRRIINPGFHHDKLHAYGAVMVEEASKRINGWTSGMRLNLVDEMTSITLAVIARLLFGIDVREETKILGDAVTTLSHILLDEFSSPLPVPEWLPLPSKLGKREAVQVIDRLIARAISEHQTIGAGKGDLLSMLLQAVDKEGDGRGMTPRQVRDEAITLFNAGHDSTAAALSWTWYLLLKNPAVYDQLLDQIDSLLLGKPGSFADLRQIPLAAQVAKESLRLYPPTWILPRQCNQDTEIGGYLITKGSQVNLFPYIIQRDERFFDEPDQFRPERFDSEHEHSICPFAFFPFGAGPRACIGKDFALMQMQLVMLTVSQKFQFSLVNPEQEILPLPLVSLEPKGGVDVIVTERSKRH